MFSITVQGTSVSWCVNEEGKGVLDSWLQETNLEARKFYPLVLLVVYETEEDDGDTVLKDVHRQIEPFTDGGAFLDVHFAGDFEVQAVLFLPRWCGSKRATLEDCRFRIIEHEEYIGGCRGLLPEYVPNMRILDEVATATIHISPENFGTEPPQWVRWWVDETPLFGEANWSANSCELYRRALFAFTIKPIPWAMKMLMTIIVRLLFATAFTLWGVRHVAWNRIFRDLQKDVDLTPEIYSFRELFRGEDNRFVFKKDGSEQPHFYRFFSPFFLGLVGLGGWSFIHLFGSYIPTGVWTFSVGVVVSQLVIFLFVIFFIAKTELVTSWLEAGKGYLGKRIEQHHQKVDAIAQMKLEAELEQVCCSEGVAHLPPVKRHDFWSWLREMQQKTCIIYQQKRP